MTIDEIIQSKHSRQITGWSDFRGTIKEMKSSWGQRIIIFADGRFAVLVSQDENVNISRSPLHPRTLWDAGLLTNHEFAQWAQRDRELDLAREEAAQRRMYEDLKKKFEGS